MLKIFAKISMALFLVAVPFLFYGFGGEFLKILTKISLRDSRWLAFLAGLITFFPCVFVARRLFSSAWSYLETLEHEITHLLIGLFFLRIPVSIRVSAHNGGEVQHRETLLGATGLTWVALAPYFFPTITLLVLIFAFFIDLSPKTFLFALGWTTAFHLVTNWGETSFRQPDLQKAGILKTILILPVMNLISYGAIFAFVGGERKGFGIFLIEGLKGAFALTAKIWQTIT